MEPNKWKIKLNLSIQYKLKIIGAYGINDKLFEQLNKQIGGIGTTREVILCGDFCSRVNRNTNDKVVDQFGEDILNDNGERLIDISAQNLLTILNGFINIEKYIKTHGHNQQEDWKAL